MINPATLYTLRNTKTSEVIFQTINYQDILDLIIKPYYIEKDAIVTLPDMGKEYKIENVVIIPYQTAQMYLNNKHYIFHTLIWVSPLE